MPASLTHSAARPRLAPRFSNLHLVAETGAAVLTHAGWGQGAWVSDWEGNMKVSKPHLATLWKLERSDLAPKLHWAVLS